MIRCGCNQQAINPMRQHVLNVFIFAYEIAFRVAKQHAVAMLACYRLDPSENQHKKWIGNVRYKYGKHTGCLLEQAASNITRHIAKLCNSLLNPFARFAI